MGITRITAILGLSLAMYVAVYYTEAQPTDSLKINSIFLGLCPRYLQVDNCDEFIAKIQDELQDQPDVIVHLQLAEEGELGLRNSDPSEPGIAFESACEILEHLCTPIVQVPAGARFRRQASGSNSNSTSASASGSGSAEST